MAGPDLKCLPDLVQKEARPLGCQVVLDKVMAPLSNNAGRCPRVIQTVVNKTFEMVQISKSQDLNTIDKIVWDVQRHPGGDVDCIAGGVFPETKGIVTRPCQ